MALLDVSVKIQLSKPVGAAGTWFPCLYVIDEDASSDVYKEYRSLADMATDYAETTDAYKAASLIFQQDNAPDRVAVLKQSAFSADTFGDYLNKGWRQLVPVGTNEKITEMATYIASTDKMLFVTMSDKSEFSTTSGGAATKKFDNDRMLIVYHDTEPNAAAAVVGATAGLKAGSFTYKNIIVKGVNAVDISDTELEDIHKLGAITILEKAGDIVTSEGKVTSDEYADIIDSKDYVIQNIAYKTQKVLNNNNKVAYTDAGIGLLETATLEALVDGYNNGMIADKEDGTPDYSVSFALRSQTTATDRASRKYPYGRFAFALAGAIHTAEINGEVTL